MGKTIRAAGSSHKRNAQAIKPAKRSARFTRDLEDIPNFKQISTKIAAENFDSVKR